MSMKLFESYPRPWAVVKNEVGHVIVLSAKAEEIFISPNFTGDGAIIALDEQQVRELVDIVNASL